MRRSIWVTKIYLKTRWASLLQLGVGAVVFSFIFASIPIFQEVTRTASHKFELEQSSAETLSIHSLLPNRPLELEWYHEADRVLREAAQDTVTPFISGIGVYGNIQSAYVVVDSEELRVTPSSPQALLQFAEGIEAHTRIVAGTWPFKQGGGTEEIPIAIGRESATLLGVGVGSKLGVIPDPTNLERQLSGVVRAVIEAENQMDIYWMGYDRLSPYPVGSGMRSYMVTPLTIGMNDFLSQGGSKLAPITANYWWYGVIDKDALEKLDSRAPPLGVQEFESKLNQRYPRGSVFSSLDILSRSAIAREDAVRLALYIGFAALLSFSVVYFLVLGSTFARSEFRDFRKLLDRGLSWRRVLAPSAVMFASIFALALGAGIFGAQNFGTKFLAWRFNEGLGIGIVDPDIVGLVVCWSVGGVAVGIVAFVSPFVMRIIVNALDRHAGVKGMVPIYLHVGMIGAGIALGLHGANSGTESDGNFIGANIALIVGPAMTLLGASGLCAQLIATFADLIRVRLGRAIPQRAFIFLAMLRANIQSTMPLLVLGTLAVMVFTMNSGLVSSISGGWGGNSPKNIGGSVLADPVVGTILNAFVIGCLIVIGVVSTLGVVTVTANTMRYRQQFIRMIHALGYPLKDAWLLAFLETVLPITLSMAGGFLIARNFSRQFFPLLLEPGGKAEGVAAISESGAHLQMVLGLIAAIEVGLVITFFLLKKLNPQKAVDTNSRS
jgi:hypothetical protein